MNYFKCGKITIYSLLGFFFLFGAAAVIFPCAFPSACAEFVLPERPQSPTPPARPKPREQEARQQKKPEKAAPAPEQSAPTTHFTNKESDDAKALAPKPAREKKSAKTQASEANLKPPAASLPAAAASAEPSDDEKQDRRANAAKQENLFFDSFLKYTLYSMAIIAMLAFTGYLYFTTPKNKQAPANSFAEKAAALKNIGKASEKTAAPPPIRPANQVASAYHKASLPLQEVKIINRSLLEQLVKYDMENYGEIRSNLNYEQPAYVEKLIRKYGGNDQQKINRALHLFYQKHEK